MSNYMYVLSICCLPNEAYLYIMSRFFFLFSVLLISHSALSTTLTVRLCSICTTLFYVLFVDGPQGLHAKVLVTNRGGEVYTVKLKSIGEENNSINEITFKVTVLYKF
ncbi:hypothetical protein CROQUDRAFT_598365 [Cronartium quercuum f. sp. fusiforme G11]|uniref:Uncharacterized protein n=1 Tax=Cronartium quercuum f. sp. fusiforme G11 TaxID=708437 RepID=A0A9P6NVF6_9BASI|nr:hypothetical protein CROQUDRAFT_598365 [Cronartium quercuum f. sp. fusiforme G11]